MIRRLTRALLATVALLGGGMAAATAVTAVTATPASASCTSPPAIVGSWHNTNANTSAMTRIDVEWCQSLPGSCTGEICSTGGYGTMIRAWGKCHPTDCYWGRKVASTQADGWEKATFAFGFKTSAVWVKTYQYYGLTYLRVWVYNDFAPSDGRADYVTDEWFLK